MLWVAERHHKSWPLLLWSSDCPISNHPPRKCNLLQLQLVSCKTLFPMDSHTECHIHPPSASLHRLEIPDPDWLLLFPYLPYRIADRSNGVLLYVTASVCFPCWVWVQRHGDDVPFTTLGFSTFCFPALSFAVTAPYSVDNNEYILREISNITLTTSVKHIEIMVHLVTLLLCLFRVPSSS